jgi:anti-sigma-K factor RskA
MNGDHIQQLADLYVLGALPPQEAEEVEAHLESCLDCQDEVSRAWEAGKMLRFAVPQVTPSDSLRDRILATARADLAPVAATVRTTPVVPAPIRVATTSGSSWRDWFRWLSPPRLAGAVAIVPLLLSAWLTAQVLSMQRQVQDTQQSLVNTQQTLVETQQALGRAAQNGLFVAEFLGKGIERGTSVTPLVPTAGAPGASGNLYYVSSTNEGVLVVKGLVKENDDKVYQVWLMNQGRIHSGGTFYCDETGRGMLVIRDGLPLQSAEMLRITKEPRGGSDQPHEPAYMWGRLQGT